MATIDNQSQSSTIRKTRRRHHKSRNGCLECKRRRIKCDELKPSCTRCVLGLDKCIYPPAVGSVANEPLQKDELSLPSSSCSTLSRSPSAPPSYPERSSRPESSAHSTPEFQDANGYSNPADAGSLSGLSDADLYHHYLQHTSRTLSNSQRDQTALQIGMPTLALQSKTVFHSLLAASAACMCCDMISKDGQPDINKVSQFLTTGYRHYTLASERMRESISSPGALKLEPLLASALMLVPFATASQQINQWISGKSETHGSRKLLSSTPRDVIIMMRGIRATLQTLDSGSLSPNPDKGLASDHNSPTTLPEVNTRPPASLTPSRTHVMTPILAATSEGAFSKLQSRLDSALAYQGHRQTDSPISACSAAFDIVKEIRNNTFSASNLSSPPISTDLTDELFESEPVSPPHVASWLRSFASRSVIPRPTEPLTRFFLSFYVRAPQAYLDLVLPLLDQRLASPVDNNRNNTSTDLTREQALALDVYAHWSVLMFLVEEESWWIGNLPLVTMSGMVNRYGDDFVTRLWPRQEPWWPGSMLTILREIKRHQ